MDVDESAAAAASGVSRSVSSRLEAASKPQLVALLTKQMARIKEAERRAAEASAKLAALQRQSEVEEAQRAAAQAEAEAERRRATEAQSAELESAQQRLRATESQLETERAEAQRQQQRSEALQARVEQLQAQAQAQQQQEEQQARTRPVELGRQTADGGAALHTPSAQSAAPVEEEQHRALHESVTALRHAAEVRSYEERLSGVQATLQKYKGVTAKLHDKLRGMAEQIKQLHAEQHTAAAVQRRAEAAVQARADEQSALLDVVEAAMGGRERAQWEADMASEEEGRRAQDMAAELSDGERSQEQRTQQAADGEGAAAAVRSNPEPATANGAGGGALVDGSLSRLSRLLAAVQRQSGEVRRMKEESLNQLLALSQAQQAQQHKSAERSLHTPHAACTVRPMPVRAHSQQRVDVPFSLSLLPSLCVCVFCVLAAVVSLSASQQSAVEQSHAAGAAAR